ncbi:MAG TPA: PD-(D/E)XK nuclease family protein [Actinomycetota bacterium]|nr:PD-(D/E)XK nuclease family protein [Actinomycetota bacterium]
MLSPVQERTLVELMGSRDERPVFRRSLREDLLGELERRVAPAVERLPPERSLWVTKARLTDLHLRCEGLFVANELDEAPFDYSMPLAIGNLVHRTIEAGVSAPDRSEAELVDAALIHLRRDDPRFDAFVSDLPVVERADLEAEAVRQVVLFRATFPPLQRSWTPAVEVPLKAEVAEGRVVLYARPDLCLGSADPDEPMRARRLIVELKTGTERPEHDEDLRFYALAATLRLGVPPFRVATLLLGSGTWRVHDVTEDLLRGAVRRIGDGCVRAAALLAGERPSLRPGPWCRWCPRAQTCPASSVRGAGGDARE